MKCLSAVAIARLTRKKTAAKRLSLRLLSLPSLCGAAVVAGYQPTRGEIDPTGALSARERQGAVVTWPRVRAARPRLSFHRAPLSTDWAPGAFGLREPLASCPWVPAESIDAFIVPGLAFDPQGRRLGWGGGFYDELASSLPGARRILVGVAHDFQVIGRCPADPYDVLVDWVVTDQKVIRCAKRNSLTDFSS